MNKDDYQTRLATLNQLLMQADARRATARAQAKACPEYELQVKELDKRVQNSKRYLEYRRTRVKDLEEMGAFGDFFFSMSHTISKQDKIDSKTKKMNDAEERYEKDLSLKQEAENQIKSLKKEVDASGESYEHLFKEKEMLMADSPRTNPIVRDNLYNLKSRYQALQTQIKTSELTLSTAEKALASLKETSMYLSHADGWGTFDMFGGGMMASAIKNDDIRIAQKASKKATEHMKQLKECEGLEHALAGMAEGFTGFADVFFDNFFIDWHVQTQITNASRKCNVAKDKVSQIVKHCKSNLSATRKEFEACHIEWKNLVLEYDGNDHDNVRYRV